MLIFEQGTIVDERYEIIRLLGQGGMSSVYLAQEPELDRLVALKMMLPDLLDDEEQQLRFQREGKMLSSLSHRNVLRVYRLGIWKKTYPFIAMEYLEGGSLREAMDSAGGHLPWDRCLHIAIQICQAMQSAHNAKIVHRDLKPQNIMLQQSPEPDLVKILDFGLARFLPDKGKTSQHLTQTGALVGSLSYMSPEQCLGKKADNRSDIYSLGCIMYEALSGSPPFEADNPYGVMHKHVSETPALLRTADSSPTPTGLQAVIAKAMAKDPAQRYQSMAELQSDLELVRANKGEELIVAALESTGRTKGANLVVATVLTLVVFLTGALYWQQRRQSQLGAALTSTAEPPASMQTAPIKMRVSSDPALAMHRCCKIMESAMKKSDAQAVKELLMVDSYLESISAKLPQNGPMRLHALLLRGNLFKNLKDRTKDPIWAKKAEQQYLLALPIAKSHRAEAAVYSYMGELIMDDDPQKAAKYFERSLTIAKTVPFSTGFVTDNRLPGSEFAEANTYFRLQIGRCAQKTRDLQKATYQYEQLLREANLFNQDTVYAMDTLFQVYRKAGRTHVDKQFMENIEKLLKKQEVNQIGKTEDMAGAYSVLATRYADLGDLDKAVHLQSEAVKRLDASTYSPYLSCAGNSVELLRQAT